MHAFKNNEFHHTVCQKLKNYWMLFRYKIKTLLLFEIVVVYKVLLYHQQLQSTVIGRNQIT